MSIDIPGWVKDAVWYQIFPDRFASSSEVIKPGNLEPWESPPTTRGFKGGDLLGILEHLDYLTDLGINAIYLNPIFQSAANHRYHTHDYYRVDPILGGDAAFRALLEGAHRRGIRVMLDGVFNHASRGFLQFNHLLENGTASPYLDWFVVLGWPLRAFDHRRHPNYVAWWNNRELPKLNTDNPQVTEFLMGVAEYWLQQGIDGWRLDVPLEITTPGFWEEFRRRVRSTNPEAYILAEIWHDARPWLQGEHFDATMNYGFNRACYGFFGGEWLNTSERPGGFQITPLDGPAFAAEITRLLYLYHPEIVQAQFNLLSSHDEPRFLTMVGGDTRRLRLATLFQMTFPGAPCVYYGDEIGMAGGADPQCRGAFIWDERQWDLSLHADLRRFIRLRHEHPVLRAGAHTIVKVTPHAYVFARHDAHALILVALNVGAEEVSLDLDLDLVLPGRFAAEAQFADAWSGAPVQLRDGRLTLKVPSLDGVVLVHC
jgi:cyclomaltodextrinase / maltogenic alpha-amylase / neopullulanase